MAKPAKYALTVLAAPELSVAKAQLKKLQDGTVQVVHAVTDMEANAAKAAVLAGFMLYRTKHSMPGKFTTFLEEILPQGKKWTAATAVKNASFYMRLTLAFLEKSKLKKGDLLALPEDAATLALGNAKDAKKFADALGTFVGDHSLNELLIKHGIKGVGLKTALDQENEAEDEGGDDELTPAQQAKLARENAWLGVWNPVQEIRTSLADPNTVQLLTDAGKIEQLKAELVEATKLVTARLTTLRSAKH